MVVRVIVSICLEGNGSIGISSCVEFCASIDGSSFTASSISLGGESRGAGGSNVIIRRSRVVSLLELSSNRCVEDPCGIES